MASAVGVSWFSKDDSVLLLKNRPSWSSEWGVAHDFCVKDAPLRQVEKIASRSRPLGRLPNPNVRALWLSQPPTRPYAACRRRTDPTPTARLYDENHHPTTYAYHHISALGIERFALTTRPSERGIGPLVRCRLLPERFHPTQPTSHRLHIQYPRRHSHARSR